MSKDASQAYSLAESYYNQSLELEDAIKQKSFEALAASNFFLALCFGHPKAAYSLYACFGQGKGVSQNDEIAGLMFEVAKRLGDERCKKNEHPMYAPAHMKGSISTIVELITKAEQAKVTMQGLNTQIEMLDKAVSLSSGSFSDYFTQQSQPDSSEGGASPGLVYGQQDHHDAVQPAGESSEGICGGCCVIL